MIVIPRSVVERLYPPAAARASVREAVLAHRDGRDSTPGRTALHARRSEGEMLVMPAAVDASAFAVKIWHRFEAGHGRLPPSSASIMLLDPDLGEEVLLDGSCITDRRTAAMTALMALAYAPPQARVLTVIGAGLQARSSIEALLDALPALEQVRVVSRRASSAQALVDELEPADGTRRWTPFSDVSEAVAGADVIVAATTSSTPVVPDDAVAPGALVCGVGSHDVGSAEIEPATVARAAVRVVDTLAGGLDSAADLSGPVAAGLLSREDVLELSAIAAGEGPPRDPERPTVFKSVGFAGLDAVAARHVARAAIEGGEGMRLDLHA